VYIILVLVLRIYLGLSGRVRTVYLFSLCIVLLLCGRFTVSALVWFSNFLKYLMFYFYISLSTVFIGRSSWILWFFSPTALISLFISFSLFLSPAFGDAEGAIGQYSLGFCPLLCYIYSMTCLTFIWQSKFSFLMLDICIIKLNSTACFDQGWSFPRSVSETKQWIVLNFIVLLKNPISSFL
jgi:hypothetical protein